MENVDLVLVFSGGLLDPGEAAGISRRDDLGVRRDDICPLLIEELASDLGLREVVDSGAAAAGVGVSEFYVSAVWDGLKKFPWLSPDSLAMGKMAGVVVGESEVEASGFC